MADFGIIPLYQKVDWFDNGLRCLVILFLKLARALCVSFVSVQRY